MNVWYSVAMPEMMCIVTMILSRHLKTDDKILHLKLIALICKCLFNGG